MASMSYNSKLLATTIRRTELTRGILFSLARPTTQAIEGRTTELTTCSSNWINQTLLSLKDTFNTISASISDYHLSWSNNSRTVSSIIDPNSFYGLGGLLKAVPKKKVSHSRKRMRSAHKGIQPTTGLGICPGCGEPKRQHFLCLHCYADKVLERSPSIKTPWEKGITP
ncbi:hypothetical protein MJO29_004531 [Puccinia striiformis f. sp. tritici]|uniref:Large ribosomal subunit protein bL32m n=1 Tax=Puccinia striiformis TaxID=27350 RepID=A0A2S4ULS0_9BASI|nr:hypothetical protein Pst134EB_008698 [Puccinia striiformis f. sp. tritici]KAI7964104.1 hypothetical protein MJO29_004531 [Puccinia striiformis f. sp. tritici]POV98157.1 hypothetical protein PSHT_14182 [Puccinia striiformis]